jgi:beta-N-acetylhexosaminidase
MGAIEQHYGLAQAVVLALDAGVDLLLIAEDRLPDGGSAAAVAHEAIRTALADGRLAPRRVIDALSRVAALKRRAAALEMARIATPGPVLLTDPGAASRRRE